MFILYQIMLFLTVLVLVYNTNLGEQNSQIMIIQPFEMLNRSIFHILLIYTHLKI